MKYENLYQKIVYCTKFKGFPSTLKFIKDQKCFIKLHFFVHGAIFPLNTPNLRTLFQGDIFHRNN